IHFSRHPRSTLCPYTTLFRSPVQRVGEDLRARLAHPRGEVLERGAQRQELAQRVPAQVVLGQELLHVLRRRAAGSRLEEAAAVRSEEHTSELQSRENLVCRLL